MQSQPVLRYEAQDSKRGWERTTLWSIKIIIIPRSTYRTA